MKLAQRWSWEIAVKTDSETEAELFCAVLIWDFPGKVRVKGRADF